MATQTPTPQVKASNKAEEEFVDECAKLFAVILYPHMVSTDISDEAYKLALHMLKSKSKYNPVCI